MTLQTKRVPMPSLLRRAAAEPAFPDQLDLAAGSLPLTVRRNPRAKRMILRLAPGASGVVVTAPRSASARAILSFLERHRGWVEDRLSRAPERIAIAAGATIPFRGASLLLLHVGGRLATRIEPIAAVRGRGRRAGTTAAPADAPYGEGEGARLLVGGAPEHFGRRVTDFLKREARRDLEAAVKRHAGIVGLEPKAITLKDTTSRWGSCTADRRLAFSWRIVMAPPEVLDYLAAHEVAHFREMNHGPTVLGAVPEALPRHGPWPRLAEAAWLGAACGRDGMSRLSAEALAAARVLWRFHAVYDEPVRADAIVGLGSYDLRVADRCAELFHSRIAPRLALSGRAGNWTAGLFATSEAEAFAHRCAERGVPASAILIEPEATNIGENLRLTAALLGPDVERVVIVTKPQTQRRVLAAAARQWPDVEALITAPETPFERQPTDGHPLPRLIEEMVGDLQRLIDYPARGFAAEVDIPGDVMAAWRFLIARRLRRPSRLREQHSTSPGFDATSKA